MSRARYSGWFALAVVALGVVAVYLISTARPGRSGSSALTSAEAEAGPPGRLVPDIGDPSMIRPNPDAYARYAAEDAAWRVKHAPPVTARHFAASAGVTWRPSARDLVRDSVFTLVRQARIADAIVVLDAWIADNPRDAELLLELARLLNRAGRTEESLRRYRELLALDRGGAR